MRTLVTLILFTLIFGSSAQEPLYELKIKGNTSYATGTQTVVTKSYTQRDSSSVIVGDSKCGPAGIILDENGKEVKNAIFITGRVYSDDPGKEPIPFSTVWIKGTKIGTTTNAKGLYGLNLTQVNDTASTFTLVASYIGCHPKEIIIKEKLKTSQTFDFALKSIPSCEYREAQISKKDLRKLKKQRKRTKNNE